MTHPDKILEIVRQSLERGQVVEIDGLGTFGPAGGSGYLFSPQTQPLVFIAYVAEDLPSARKLSDSLKDHGCAPWLDREKLLPGQNWPRSIARAIEISDAFIACFSARSISKHGQFQSELRWALDCARRFPLEEVFVIPVRLEPCNVPRYIAEQVQYVDLYPDWERGVQRIARSIHKAARARPSANLTVSK